MMNFNRNQVLIVFGVIFIVLVLVVGFIFFRRTSTDGGPVGPTAKKIEITLWGVEDKAVMESVASVYGQLYQNIKIVYIQFSESNYEKSLLNALASGQGPDMFMIHNTWLLKHYDKILPAPKNKITLRQLRDIFPKVVEDDFAAVSNQSSEIYALPLYIDSLAFIYNKKVFDAKGIAVMPKSWQELQYIIPRLREADLNNRITKAPAAIGGSEKSIDKASDLLSLAMLQFGAQMFDSQSSRAIFSESGLNAFNFYLSFANPQNSYYSWNDSLRNSLDGFSQENVAVIFNYQSSVALLKAKNPFLSFEVAPMLQFDEDNPVNYADYWGLAVSRQSQNSANAWNFVLAMATNEQLAEQYLQASRRPPALRTLIQKYSNDPDLGVFAKQALTAKSWPQPDNAEVKKIFSNMIESVLVGKSSPQKALKQAENEINALK